MPHHLDGFSKIECSCGKNGEGAENEGFENFPRTNRLVLAISSLWSNRDLNFGPGSLVSYATYGIPILGAPLFFCLLETITPSLSSR